MQISFNGAHRRGISAQAARRMGNTHTWEQHIISSFDIHSLFYKRGIRLLDGLHIWVAFVRTEKDELDDNNNEG